MSEKFSIRTASGMYRPLPYPSAYDIELQNQLTNGSIWTQEVSTNPFIIVDDSHITMKDADVKGGWMYWAGNSGLTDQYSQITYLSSSGVAPHVDCGGLIVRHNPGSGFAATNSKGYYFLIVLNINPPFVFTWELGIYAGTASTYNYSVKQSGTLTLATNDVFKLTAVGTVLTVYQNGSSLGTFTDGGSGIPTGRPGLMGGREAADGTTRMLFKDPRLGSTATTVPVIPQQFRGSGYYFGVQ